MELSDLTWELHRRLLSKRLYIHYTCVLINAGYDYYRWFKIIPHQHFQHTLVATAALLVLASLAWRLGPIRTAMVRYKGWYKNTHMIIHSIVKCLNCTNNVVRMLTKHNLWLNHGKLFSKPHILSVCIWYNLWDCFYFRDIQRQCGLVSIIGHFIKKQP